MSANVLPNAGKSAQARLGQDIGSRDKRGQLLRDTKDKGLLYAGSDRALNSQKRSTEPPGPPFRPQKAGAWDERILEQRILLQGRLRLGCRFAMRSKRYLSSSVRRFPYL